MTRLSALPRRSGHAAPASPARKVVVASLLGLVLLQVWLLVYGLLLTPLQAHHSQAVLYSQFREQLALQTAPVGGSPISVGTPVALIDFPAAGIKREIVVEGTDSGALEKGVGHERDTVLPCQAGYTVLQGRAQLYGGPFGGLGSVKPGAVLTITTGEGVCHYTVLAVDHAGDPLPATSSSNILDMITADSSGWRSGWAPSKTLNVYASLKETAFAGSAGATIAKSEMPMKGDPGALFVLILWIPLLFAAVMATMWAVARWGRWQAWLVGMPLILATLWGFSQAAFRLLPNLT